MLAKIIGISSALAIVVLVIILQTTTPQSAGLLGILGVFILMYVSALGMLTFLIVGVNRVAIRIARILKTKRPIQTMTLLRAYYFGSITALSLVMLIGMMSVGSFGFYNLLLVAIFTIVACTYIARRTA